MSLLEKAVIIFKPLHFSKFQFEENQVKFKNMALFMFICPVGLREDGLQILFRQR